jgi:hypothetical protein
MFTKIIFGVVWGFWDIDFLLEHGSEARVRNMGGSASV